MEKQSQEEKSKKLYQALKPLLEQGKKIEIHPTGTSMFPLLSGSDVVVVRKIEARERVKRNDIILYQRKGGLLVLHRLYRKRGDGYYFVGDNQTELEGPLKREALLAIVTDVCRHGRWFPVSHPWYVCLSRLWLWLRPVRPYISRPIGVVYRLLVK